MGCEQPCGTALGQCVEPPGGKLILDGKESWPLPVRIPAPAEGKRTWRLEAPNAEPLEGELTFARGKNLFFHHKLASSAGRFSVRSTPEGASVRLDGAAVGQTPLDLQGIAQGKHTVLVEKEGYATAIRSVDTSGGAKGVDSAAGPSGQLKKAKLSMSALKMVEPECMLIAC
jgi:hypothetical protein